MDSQPSPFTTPVDILAQDPTNYVEGLPLVQAIGTPKTLASVTVIDSYTIDLTAGHGLTGGEQLYIAGTINNKVHFLYAKVLSVATNTLTLDTPVNQTFPVNSYVSVVVSNMNVNGSVTRQSFSASIPTGSNLQLDIMSLRFIITDETAMDDGKFGSITALTRGMVVRKRSDDGDRHMNWNLKNNGDFGLTFNNKSYSDRGGGGGTYAMESTVKFREDFGAVVRLSAGEKLEIIIQDDLTALTSFKCFASFHIVD